MDSSWTAEFQSPFAPSQGCELRGTGSSVGERQGELGDGLIEGREIAARDAPDVNVSSMSEHVKAKPVF